jgi:hypothetical protein
MVLALILWLMAFIIRTGDVMRNPLHGRSPIRAGLIDGLVFGPAYAIVAGSAFFGGVGVIRHYFLRLMLWLKGRTPLNLVRFLDYAAKDLNFLQKVGGGYMFIHRMLLDHFAAMDVGDKSNPQETQVLSSTKALAPVSPNPA